MLSKLRARNRAVSGRHVLIAALVLAIGIPSIAIGASEGDPLIGGERNPTSRSQTLNAETQIIANNGTYATRQSNKGSGGGAVYGCRTDAAKIPCLRAKNLKLGDAFEFETKGARGGVITLGDESGAPLTTNAKGIATGFNADKVDGSDAADFAKAGDLKFAVVSADSKLSAARGATGVTAAASTFTVTFDADISKCSYTGTAQGDPAVTLSVETGTDPKTVVVKQSTAAPKAFHLQVIC